MTPRKVYIEGPVVYWKDKDQSLAEVLYTDLGDVITPEIEHIFSFGQCHALAVALHELLGWEVMGTYSPWGDDRSTFHYVVQCPDKRGTADVHGIRCVDYSLRKMDPQAMLKRKPRQFFPLAMGFARHYAKIIAPDIQKQWEALRAGKSKPRWTLCSEGYDD